MAPAIARCLLIVATLTMATGVLSLASAWVFYQDDRLRSHSTMVGTLEIDLPEGRGLSTAVLVDGCGILTNFHAVFGPWYVTALRAPSREAPGRFTLTEATGPDGTHPSARAIPVVWGDYRGPDRQLRTPQHDWAYLVLDQCLGLDYGYFQLRSPELDESAGGFAALGYSTGQQMIDPACSIQADRSRGGSLRWLHDCALRAGESGGPIIRRGTMAVVALGAGMVADPADPRCNARSAAEPRHWSPRCANVAVPLTPDLIERVSAARVATGVQRALLALGYDAGALGAVDEPAVIAAIRQVQHEMGWSETGAPSDALRKILFLRLKLVG